MARAIGETAPIITIGALTFIAFLPPAPFTGDPPAGLFDWLFAPFTVMPIQMFNWTSRPEAAFQANAAAAGFVLVLMTLAMNGAGDLAALSPAQEHQVVTATMTKSPIEARPTADLKAEVTQPQFLLRQLPRAEEHQHAGLREEGDRADRSLGLRQVDAAALLQPHARPVSGQPLRGRASGSIRTTPTCLLQHVDPIEVRMRISMVFQKPNPFPEVDLRERGLRPARARRAQSRRCSTRRSSRPCAAPRCGTR